MEASVIYSLIQQAENSEIFKKIDLARCRRANSFQTLQRYSEIKAVQRLFQESSLIARMGYNMGTQDISFTINLPTSETHPVSKVNDLFHSSKTALIIWIMLGIVPFQTEIEAKANRNLANSCLQLFKEQSTIALCGRYLDLQRGYLRLVLCTHEDTLDPATGRFEFVYSPSYHILSGISEDRSRFTEDDMTLQKEQFITQMMNYFWKYMENERRYLAVDTLREALTNSLSDYLFRGLHGQSEEFLAPFSTPFHFYLYGTAGIGKSAFVRSFSASLQATLQKFIDPKKVVSIVKVPLNAFTPGNLRGILRVKGISDMSIERIIEQTLAKGGIVVFHLEENPDDPSLQDALFEQTSKMLDHLVKRYPEYRANILTITTSNYPPSEQIANASTLLTMSPPSHKQQFRWCKMMLEDTIKAMTNNAFHFSVHIQVDTPNVNDLRPLEQWWRSLAFGIGSHLLHNNKSNELEKDGITIDIDGEDGCYDITFPKNSNFETITMCSYNSFFYYNLAEQEDNLLVEKYGLASVVSPVLTTIFRMVEEGFLTPAVIVLAGDIDQRLRWATSISKYLQERYQERLRSTELELFTEDDKSKVFGEPHEILGGLYRFIDNVNNPNACNGETNRIGLIYSHVNEIGQFILRELLEPGNSKTHRQIAKKERLLFLLSLVEYAQLTPQVHSRSHFIVQC